MKEPPLPSNEADRLAALESYEVLDTMPEQTYDDAVKLAARLFDTPIALISLVDSERQWFKARHGLDVAQTARRDSFCGHAVASGDRLVVEDAQKDERFADNPLVTGEPRLRFYAGSPLVDDAGHVFGTVCVIDHVPRELDRTQLEMLDSLARLVMGQLESRRRELRLLKSEAARGLAEHQQSRLFELSQDLLCVAGFDGYFKEINPAWTTTLGYSKEELLARPFLDFVHPDDRERTLAEAQALMRHERRVWDFENRYMTKSGEPRWLQWAGTFDPVAEKMHAVGRDVTDRKKHERELTLAKELADSANLAKSVFLANMSHELRTPLNSVIGFTNILRKNRKGHLPEADALYLERIAANGWHLLALINDVLDLSKIESGRLTLDCQDVDLCNLLDEVVGEFESQAAAKNTVLSISCQRDLALVPADPQRLRQVFTNLIGNAIKFTESGAVEVRVETHSAFPSVPVRVDVVDSGMGISEELQEFVFEPFRQVEDGQARKHAGTGLGLSISRSLCTLHGFDLDVVSRPGEGSTFYVGLRPGVERPVHVPPTARNSDRETPAGSAVEPAVSATQSEFTRSAQRTVLVIDDDNDTRFLLSEWLEKWGFAVVTAGHGESGMSIARAVSPDLILLDLMLPGASGWDVLRALAKDPKLSDTPVIVCSIVGSENKADLTSALAVLDKPLNKGALRGIIEALAPRGEVLVVEDSRDSQLLMRSLVESMGAECRVAATGVEAIQMLEQKRPSAVILDLAMPEMNGFSFLEHIRAREEFRDIPVVVCTALDLTAAETEGLRCATSGLVRKGGSIEGELKELLARFV